MTTPGWRNLYVGAPAAWQRSRGKGVRIGVIDVGFNAKHPALKTAIVGGARAQGSAMKPWKPGWDMPLGAHGTSCVGMAAARSTAKVPGLAPTSDALLFCVNGWAVQDQRLVSAAVITAAGLNGHASEACDVIVCSLGPDFGGFKPRPRLKEALERAAKEGRQGLGCPIFWAAPNKQSDASDVSKSPHVVGVGSIDSKRKHYGDPGSAQIYAPGHGVHTPGMFGWRKVRGTSFAAPMAAGLAALLIAFRPAWDRDQVVRRIKSSLNDEQCIDADRALRDL